MLHISSGSLAGYSRVKSGFSGAHICVSVALEVDHCSDVLLSDEPKLMSIAIEDEVADITAEAKWILWPEKLSKAELASLFKWGSARSDCLGEAWGYRSQFCGCDPQHELVPFVA